MSDSKEINLKKKQKTVIVHGRGKLLLPLCSGFLLQQSTACSNLVHDLKAKELLS